MATDGEVKTTAGPAFARNVIVALGPGPQPSHAGSLIVCRSSSSAATICITSLPDYRRRGPCSTRRKVTSSTPMTRGLRLTTGAEFAPIEDAPLPPAHIHRIEPFAREMFFLGTRLDPQPWLGRRPCLPDMLPVISAAPRHAGLWVEFWPPTPWPDARASKRTALSRSRHGQIPVHRCKCVRPGQVSTEEAPNSWSGPSNRVTPPDATAAEKLVVIRDVSATACFRPCPAYYFRQHELRRRCPARCRRQAVRYSSHR